MKIEGQRRNRSVFCGIKCHIVPRRRHGIIVKPARGKEGLGYIGSMSEPMDCSSSGTHASGSTAMSDRDVTPFGTARSRPAVPAHDHDPCTSRPQNLQAPPNTELQKSRILMYPNGRTLFPQSPGLSPQEPPTSFSHDAIRPNSGPAPGFILFNSKPREREWCVLRRKTRKQDAR